MKKKLNDLKIKISILLKEDLTKRFVNVILFGAGGAIISKILLTVFNMILARILSENDYGIFSLINNTIQTFIVFSGAGLGITLTRYVALYKDNNKNLTGIFIGTLLMINFLISLLILIIIFAFSNDLSNLLSNNLDVSYYLKITSFIILITSMVLILQGLLQGFEKFKTIAIIQVFGNLINFILGLFISNFFGLTGAVYSMLIYQIFIFLFMLKSIICLLKEKKIHLKISLCKDVKNSILNVAFPTFLASIFVLPLMWIANFIFTKHNGFEELAAFSVCLQWYNIINYIPQQFGQAGPIYTDLYEKGQIFELKKYLKKIIKFSVLFTCICSLIFILFKNIILGIYGDFYLKYSISFAIMIITTIFYSLQSQFGSVFQAIGKSWICFLLNFIWGISFLILFVIFCKFKAIGYSITYLISYSIYSILSILIFNFTIKKEEDKKTKI